MAQESEFTNIGYGKVKPQLGQGAAQVLPNDLAAGDFRGKQLAAQNSARKQKREDAFAKQLADYDLSNPITNPYYREIYQRELDATNKLINGLRYDNPMSVRKASMAFNNLESLQKELNSSKWDAGMASTDPNMIYSDELNLYRSGKTEDLKQLSIEELKRKGTFGGYHEKAVDFTQVPKDVQSVSKGMLEALERGDTEIVGLGDVRQYKNKRELEDAAVAAIEDMFLGRYVDVYTRQVNGGNSEMFLDKHVRPFIKKKLEESKYFKKAKEDKDKGFRWGNGFWTDDVYKYTKGVDEGVIGAKGGDEKRLPQGNKATKGDVDTITLSRANKDTAIKPVDFYLEDGELITGRLREIRRHPDGTKELVIKTREGDTEIIPYDKNREILLGEYNLDSGKINTMFSKENESTETGGGKSPMEERTINGESYSLGELRKMAEETEGITEEMVIEMWEGAK